MSSSTTAAASAPATTGQKSTPRGVARREDDGEQEREFSSATTKQQDWVLLFWSFVVSACCKILLFSSYRSTDFDVHRHWKALTRHLPSVEHWYYDDLHVDTRHTLDYPPTFAYFEWFLSTNPITQYLLQRQIVDDRCLQLLDDADNEEYPPSDACVAFMRSTVIACSDTIFWIGAWRLATATTRRSSDSGFSNTTRWTIFLLLVCNPGLLWLDHIHFQYNGILLGILMLSLSCLIEENLLTGAFLFALLLTMKHLYLSLSLWYFAYLLRSYCFKCSKKKLTFSARKFLQIALVSGTIIILPFLPFVATSLLRTTTSAVDGGGPVDVLKQILLRLFPFSRGLVHDYWAGNVWALFMGLRMWLKQFLDIHLTDDIPPSRVALLLLASLCLGATYAWIAAASAVDATYPETTRRQQPHHRDTLMLTLLSFAYSAMASFQLGYHVHEKAIMTVYIGLVPLAVIACSANAATSWELRDDNTNEGDGGGGGNKNNHNDNFISAEKDDKDSYGNNPEGEGSGGQSGSDKKDDDNDSDNARQQKCAAGNYMAFAAAQRQLGQMHHQYELLLWETSAYGLLGIFPLLFQPREILLRWVSYVGYMCVLSLTLFNKNDKDIWRLYRYSTTLVGTITMFVFDAVPSSWWGRFEFAPLAFTSGVCALGLLVSFLRLTYCMVTAFGVGSASLMSPNAEVTSFVKNTLRPRRGMDVDVQTVQK